MTKVSSKEDIERESKRVISALYGNISDFRVNETFQIPEKGPREALLEHEKEFDLIVVGRADWGSKLLGSVSNGVVSNSKKDILLVK